MEVYQGYVMSNIILKLTGEKMKAKISTKFNFKTYKNPVKIYTVK